ncbi:MAG: hypothetical protein PHH67_02950 [Methanosarcina sp.]|nr:hypothetical protein [Methanosarcina sp.]MDD3316155.1 hypothetical protein [Methanosarcina sp.]MDD4305465.1 hypothetical protein [Methanosarcina sp.]MDD4620094.1 hypothetical protein [Methanosarcina sp.]
MNLNEVSGVKKSILQTEKMFLNSVYPGDTMNMSVTFCVADETSSTLQRIEAKTKDPSFGYPNNINLIISTDLIVKKKK